MSGAAPPVFYTTPGREPPEVVGRAFCEGCGGQYRESRLIENAPAVFYGLSKFTVTVHRAASERGYDWYYIDNGYFRPGHYDGYYRVTKNAAQHDGSGKASPARWDSLGLTIEPWKRDGRHVLVIGQSRTYFDLRGMRGGNWLWDTLAAIGNATDRPIVVRPKPTMRTLRKRPVATDLEDAWCVVAHTSNVAVEAVQAGVPVFVTGDCAAASMSETDLAKIETPVYPDREQWAWNLAANQWTLDEFRTGKCWRDLQSLNAGAGCGCPKTRAIYRGG